MLALDRLEKVRTHADKITARCPACAKDGGDHHGVHLAIWPETGKFTCAAHPGDHAHRSVIWALAGLHDGRTALSLFERRAFAARRQAEQARTTRQARLHDAATQRKAAILRDYAWPIADVLHDSPRRLESPADGDWRDFLSSLYPDDAVVWIGEKNDSGSPRHNRQFRPVGQWLADHPNSPSPPGPLTCPDTFIADVCSRAGANVAARPYLVVEADAAIGSIPQTPDECRANVAANLALIRWLRDACHWHLCAVIHTGNKSCHGWFRRPHASYIEDLKSIAAPWGLDPSVSAASHPVRLPGIKHAFSGEFSRCLFLATNGIPGSSRVE